MISVTRRLEFDAGHRIPDHHSQCRNLHGHRYALEVTLQGEMVVATGASEHGMVMDFAHIKAIANKHLVDLWDHAFLLYAGDTPVRQFLESLPQHKTVLLEHIPTAENLARIAFYQLAPHYQHQYGTTLRLEKIRLYETPNCWADCTG